MAVKRRAGQWQGQHVSSHSTAKRPAIGSMKEWIGDTRTRRGFAVGDDQVSVQSRRRLNRDPGIPCSTHRETSTKTGTSSCKNNYSFIMTLPIALPLSTSSWALAISSSVKQDPITGRIQSSCRPCSMATRALVCAACGKRAP